MDSSLLDSFPFGSVGEFDSDKTYQFNDKELKAEELVDMYIEKGKS